jgi:protein involved in polysaccharide export with SLBB domain
LRSPVSIGTASSHLLNPDRIHFGDIIEIDLVGGFEYDWRGNLNSDGYLEDFDKIAEPVFARCKTTAELAEDVTRQYAKILRDPRIEVRILDRTNRALAYIDGAVKVPQRLRIKRAVHLNELIVIGGGFTDKTSGEITVFRPENLSCEQSRTRGPVTMNIKIADVLSGDSKANPKIVSGDIVTVLEALPIYVIGGVNNPAKLSSRNGLTLSRAVAAAGGVSKNGVAASITLYRREGGNTSVIEADLGQIAAGKTEDLVLKAFDIVDVGQKGSPKRKFPPVIEDLENRPAKFASMPLRVIE